MRSGFQVWTVFADKHIRYGVLVGQGSITRGKTTEGFMEALRQAGEVFEELVVRLSGQASCVIRDTLSTDRRTLMNKVEGVVKNTLKTSSREIGVEVAGQEKVKLVVTLPFLDATETIEVGCELTVDGKKYALLVVGITKLGPAVEKKEATVVRLDERRSAAA